MLTLSVASGTGAMQCCAVVAIDDVLQDTSWKYFFCKRRSIVTLCEAGPFFTVRLTCS